MILRARWKPVGQARRPGTSRLHAALAVLAGALLLVQSAAFAAPQSPTSPGGGTQKGKTGTVSAWPSTLQQNPAAKIDKRVSDAFASAARVSFLVKMRAQADVVGAANAARRTASPAKAEVNARAAVIDALRDTAEASQRGLLADLRKARAQGKVSKFESHYIANIVSVTASKEVMQQIARRSDVEKIMANTEIKLIKEAPVADAGSATGAPGAQSVEWNIQRVGAPAVWSTYGINGTGAVVASLDTGVDASHPALHDRWRGLDAGSGAADSWFDAVNGQTAPYDDHGHGTHTTGTAVGRDPDGTNEIGVAPGAHWIAAKILNAAGSGTAENILTAGEWLLAPGGDPSKAPDVVNNSWGGGPGMDDWFRDVVRAWRAAGIFPAFAAGNDGSADGSVSVPGNYPESFAVGATDSSDNLAGFSGRGPSPYGVIKPQVAAPGVGIRSSVPGGGYEGGWNGTSMATPHVTGTVALLRSANAALTVDQIEQILQMSADPKTDSRYTSVPNNGYGNGILNAFTAVAMVVSGTGTVNGRVVTGGDDFEPPAVTHTPVTEGFKRIPIDLTATVSDNVSVTSVQLRFRMPGMSWWGVVDMTRTSGDHKSGSYAGTIPADMTQGDQVQYYITAMDFSGNEASSGSAARPHSVTLLNGLEPGYLQDFEHGASGWTHGGTGDVWEVGEPTSGPRAAHSGVNVAATNLDGNYPDGSDSWFMSPPIDLTGGPAAVRFWHWYSTERNFDVLYVLGSGDGGTTWDVLQNYTGESGGWLQGTVDLGRFAGSGSVLLAFYLQSDGSVNKAGWYLDDVELYVDTVPPAAPANLTATAPPGSMVSLAWEAVAESDLHHYSVYRSTTSGSGYGKLTDLTALAYNDTTATPGTTYYYTVTATDLFGNESGPSNEVSVTPDAGTTIFSDDMEGGDNGWTHSGANDSWQRGTPTAGPSGAHSGTNVWGTNLTGNYGANMNASLITPPLDLSGVASANLTFAHWYSMEKDFDNAFVEITWDGGATWTRLAHYTSPDYSGTPIGWESPSIDLTAYVGHTVQIRFRMTSDGSVQYPGWYLDDVRVAGSAGATGGRGAGNTLGVPVNRIVPTAKGKAPLRATPQIKLPAPGSSNYKRVSGSAVTGVTGIGITAMPLDATVTVVETGRVVRTDPARGTFSLMLPAGTFTLRAEAYGYFPMDRTVTVEPDSSTSVIFALSPIPKGTLSGVVTDARDGDPISGATVRVAEDMRIPAAVTGSDGSFQLEVLEGAYTVQYRASGYYPAAASKAVAGGSTVNADMALEPFVGMPGEIGYDDGSADNAWAFFAAGNGWAVHMSPPNPGQTMMITGARVYLWNESWPSPGGNTMQVAVFSANADGTPGSLLAGPVRMTGAVRGAWNDVDLSGLGLIVSGDFYMAYIQDADYPAVPGVAVDESAGDTGRNYQYVGGSWAEWTQGNLMIRALVSFEVGAPTITSPANNSFTNQPAMTVRGMATAGATVTLYVDGTDAAHATPAAGGAWEAPVTLTEGTHSLTATATAAGGGTTGSSPAVSVTVDTTNPTLTLASPADGHQQNTRLLSVSGSVADVNMEGVTVNGTAATVNADGSFEADLVGREGANTITVVARDKAGNQTTLTRTVVVDSTAPVLSNMAPGTNTTLYTGDAVTVSFDAEPGLALGAFSISIGSRGSSTGKVGTASLQPGEVALTETSPGHYQGTWTLPDGMAAPAAYVRLRAVDAAGNEARATAAAVLTLVDNYRPTAVISGPTTGRRNLTMSYDGRSSSDPDGRIVSYRWDWGDGTRSNTSTGRASHRWSAAGTYTVTLTVTDNQGATGSTSITVTIR